MPKWFNWHRVGTVAATVGAFAAHYIPATLLVPLLPVSVPVAAVVSGALALAAAAGIAPSPLLARVVGSLTGKSVAPPAK